MARLIKSLEDRFMRRSHPEPNTGCWLWEGSVNKRGYGRINDGTGRIRLAHRVAYQIFCGEIPPGMEVCHKRHCYGRCVNPDHLYIGTRSSNMTDAGMTGAMRAELHPHHKLTRDKVKEIRELYASGGISQKDVGALYGVNQFCVSKIVRHKAWKAVHAIYAEAA